MLENRTYGTAADDNNTAATLTRYVYSNHLQSASLELDENAAIISYEEIKPAQIRQFQKPKIKNTLAISSLWYHILPGRQCQHQCRSQTLPLYG